MQFFTAIMLLLATMIGGGGLQHAVAQSETSHTFHGGQVLAWGGKWELDPNFTYIEGELEIATLTTGQANLHVLSVPGNVSKSDIRDTFLEGFLGRVDNPVTIDRGDYGAVSYSLDSFQLEGTEFGGFILLRESSGGGPTFAYFVIAAADAFGATISDIQKQITLNGAGFFDGIGGEGLQTQLLNAAGNGSEKPTPKDANHVKPETTATFR